MKRPPIYESYPNEEKLASALASFRPRTRKALTQRLELPVGLVWHLEHTTRRCAFRTCVICRRREE